MKRLLLLVFVLVVIGGGLYGYYFLNLRKIKFENSGENNIICDKTSTCNLIKK